MAEQFIETLQGGLQVVRCVSGKATTIPHGFIGKGLLPPSLAVEDARAIVATYLAIQNIVLPVQTHGNAIVHVAGAAGAIECEGDAIIAARQHGVPVALCIRTADCVPLVVVGGNRVGLIHAGWRGLANGIVANVLHELLKKEGDIQVLIGPCAGSAVYEVGDEVLQAIGEPAVSRSVQGKPGKHLLDLEATARAIINHVDGRIETLSCGICTMSDDRFYSFRRDGDSAGRNLTFALVE